MVDLSRKDEVAGAELAQFAHQLMSQMPPHRVALMAYIQSAMTQCSVQVLVDILVQKNMLSDAELQRRLAEAYDQFTAQLQHNLVLGPAKPTVVGGLR